MIFALAGNQNCGKTTLFNALTGSNQHVGNFPGVTVDQKMGEIRGERGCSVVDLPGIYSLRPYTQEEIVTARFHHQSKARRHHQHCGRHQHRAQPVPDAAAAGTAGAHGTGAEHDGRGARQRRHHRRTEDEPGAGHSGGSHLRRQRRGRIASWWIRPSPPRAARCCPR